MFSIVVLSKLYAIEKTAGTSKFYFVVPKQSANNPHNPARKARILNCQDKADPIYWTGPDPEIRGPIESR